ncbi:MAG: TetR/AcrR family transcriptional regulator [Mycobacterium sp.]|jgi:AcrR family transcriptional regulator
MARKKDQAKRRAEIADAMVGLLAERESHNISYADVAKQVGMTPGAIGYYFPSLDELVLQAHSAAIEQETAATLVVASRFKDPRDQLIGLIEHRVPNGPDPGWRILADAVLTAMTSVSHAVLLASLLEHQTAIFCDVLERGVAQEVFELKGDLRRIARTLTHLIDKVGFETQIALSAMSHQEARAIVVDYATMVTGADLWDRMSPPG